MMGSFRHHLALICYCSLLHSSVCSVDRMSSLPSLSSVTSSIPGLFPKNFIQDAVDKEIRRMIIDRSAQANVSKAQRALLLDQAEEDEEEEDVFKASPTQRSLRSLTESSGGEWDEINEILAALTLTVPNLKIELELLGLDITASINGSCSNIQVGDILLDWDKSVSPNNEVTLAYKIQVLEAKLKCFLQIDWDTGVLDVSDNIKLKIVLKDSSFGIAVELEGSPPANTTFLGCKAVVTIGDIASSGGFSSDIINDLNYLLVDLVRNEASLISGTICNLLDGFTETVDDLLADIADFLDPFLVDFEPVDPLAFEESLPPEPELVNFQSTTGLGNVVNVLLRNLEGILSANQLNELLNAALLDENGLLVLELGTAPTMAPTSKLDAAHNRRLQTTDSLMSDEITDPIEGCLPDLGEFLDVRRRLGHAFRSHIGERLMNERRLQLDDLGDVLENITLDDIIDTSELFVLNDLIPTKVSVLGLNNFTNAAPLKVIGEQTLLTQLSLSKIYIEVELYLDADVYGVPVRELISAGVEVKGIFLNTSYAVGLEQAQVDKWTIGTFLNTSNIVGCIVAALNTFGVSQLTLTVDFIGTPAIEGALSEAVTDLTNTAIDGFVCAYQDLVLDAIPGFFQNNVTELVNDFAACYIETSNATCKQSSLGDIIGNPGDTEGDVDFDFRSITRARQKQSTRIPGFLDFRDLLLPPEEALGLGGSGSQPYGDLVALAYSTMIDSLAAVDNATGLPAINDFLPADGFEVNSSLIEFDLDLSDIDIVGSLLKRASLYVSNLRLNNINTITAPLSFLEPTRSAHLLSNAFNFGPTSTRSIGAAADVFTKLEGNNSGLASQNEMDASLSVAEMNLLADFHVMISTLDFINFPIADILNLNCWMALMQKPDEMVDGEKMDYGFKITRMLVDIVEMSVGVSCLNCSSELLSPVIAVLEDVGAMEVMGNRLGPLIEEIATSDMVPPLLAEYIGIGDRAATLCPHSPLFNTTLKKKDLSLENIEIPPLSNQGIDTIVFAGILGVEVAAVIFSESHLDNSLELSDPLSGQELLAATEDVDLLDWYRLNETFLPMAGDLLDFVKGFLGPTEDGGLGVNGIFGDSFNLTLGLSLPLVDGYEIVIDSVGLTGLNTFKQFDILEPIAPQTLKNTISMDNLEMAVDFSVDVTNTSEPAAPYRVTFDVTDVNVTLYLFAAIDMNKIESLEIGQLLFIANILPCFLAASYDVHVPAMRVSMGGLSQPVVEGLLPDTSKVAEASLQAIFDQFSSVMLAATNSIFDHTIRAVVNDLVEDFVRNSSACMTSSEVFDDNYGTSSELIDFRDLLLSPEDALVLGGSGTQPYGDVVSTAYALVLEQLASNSTGQLLEVNSYIDDFSLSQSGEVGLLRMEDELIDYTLDFSQWIQERIRISAFDARLRNINTLVSPIAIAHPTRQPYTIENLINFGPIAGKPLNATIGSLLELEGDLRSLDMFNMFDISGEFNEIEMVAGITLHILRENLLAFPLRDVFEISCWLSMLQNPNKTKLELGSSGFTFDKVLTKLVDLRINAHCLNCTSRVLDDVIGLVDEVGASKTFGNRLGFLVEDIAKSDLVHTLLRDFVDLGDEAGRSCPHHPLYNTSSYELEDSNSTSSLSVPALSAVSVDTLLFAGILFAEIAVVIGADNHLLKAGLDTEVFHSEVNVPEGTNLVDWQNLEGAGIPFLPEAFNLVRGFLGDASTVNSLVGGFVDVNRTFELPVEGISFELAGVLVTVNSAQVVGLDDFAELNILNPIGQQTMQNTFFLERLQLTMNVSIDFLESTDPPNTLTVTFEMEGINGTMPLYVAIDADKLGALKIGSLLFLETVLPCLLSTAYGFQLEQMWIAINSISEPVFEGLLPDTSESVERSTSAIFDVYGDMVIEAVPLVFQDTVRVFMNRFLASYVDSDCKTKPTNSSLHYIDFREMFQATNSTSYSPYGDLIPMARDYLEAEFFSVNPDTQMPKINDVIIAPFTEDQSGVQGMLQLPGKLFDFDTGAFPDYGIENLGFELFDFRVENLNTVGEPLRILEPNKTRPDLLDNGATFGTEFNPLRFAIRGTLSFLSPYVDSRDEMDIFGELRAAPIFAVLLARIGSEEFLNFPLGYTSNVNCWLATLAAPALKELQAGSVVVNPIVAIHYLNIAFQSMRVSASCFNCTTGGLEVVPDLLEILETTGAKNVLGNRNVQLIVDLINSDFAQVWLLRIFQSTLAQCQYSQNSSLLELIVPNADFPRLSSYQMETGVFTATVIIQLGIVVLAETIADLKGVRPLFTDPELDIPEGTRLVDFTALDEFPTGQLALTVIDLMNDFLGTPSVDEDTGEESLPINGILGNDFMPIREYAFDDAYDIGISSLKIRVLRGLVSGFDTFTRFAVANITGPRTMRHEVGWERLQLELKMEIDISGQPEFIFQRNLQAVEDDGKLQFDLTLELADLMAVADTFVALDYELLKYLELGSFLRFDYILPCIQATILHLELSDIFLEVGRVTRMQVSNFKSPDVQAAAEDLEETLLEKYGETIASMAPNVFSAALRPLLNTLITSYLRDSDFECDKFPFDASTDGFIDFRDLLLEPAKSLKLGGSGKAQYGNVISTLFTYSQSVLRFFLLPLLTNLSFDGPLFDQGLRFDVRKFKSIFVVKISDLALENMVFGTLTYIKPRQDEPFILDNEVKLGTGRAPLGIKFRVFLAFKGLPEGSLAGVDISNDFAVSMDIQTLNVILQAFVRVLEEDFVRFPLRNMLNLNCWLATIPPPELDENGYKAQGVQSNLAVKNLVANFEELNIRIECFNCTSQGLNEWDNLLQAPGTSDDLTKSANILITDVIEMLGGDFLQDQIDRLLANAPKLCEHTNNTVDPNLPSYQSKPVEISTTSDTAFMFFVLACLIPIVLALILTLSVRTVVHKRHKKWVARLPSEHLFLIQQRQEKEVQMEIELNETTSSMYTSPEIPRIARYLIPVIVIVNIGFFLSGHLNLGGKAMIDITFAGETFRIDSFYDFSIAQSTLDMWHAGGEELAALILLFSGIWPYTKQLITLALWYLPPSVVSVSRRGQFLLWLDILAKWSMVDIFVLLITLAGFRLGGASPDYSFFPTDLWNVQLVIVPMWGLYANMIAQLISQISSHYIVMYHRRILKHGKQMYNERHHPTVKRDDAVNQEGLELEEDAVEGKDVAELSSPDVPAEERTDQLCKHPFIRPHKAEGSRLIPRRVVNGFLPISCAALSVLLVFCCSWPSLRLEMFGVIGIMVEFGMKFTKDAVRNDSIFSMTKILIDQAIYLGELKHYIGNGSLAILFVGTLLVVPIFMLATMVYLWLVPTTRKRKGRVAITLEILAAWQYVEVYMLGIIIESWQLGQISKLFLNRYCNSINPALESMAAYGVIDARDAQCFELGASIAGGAFALIPFVIGLAIVGSYVTKAYIQTLREKHEEEESLTEEDKLRAFDRTTWDNRESAIKNIQYPPVLFTDSFRWTLTPSGLTCDESTIAEEPDSDKAVTAPTYPVADTSDSDDANTSAYVVVVPLVEQSFEDEVFGPGAKSKAIYDI